MRNAKEIIQDAIDELEHHCGSSHCDCWDDDTRVLVNELEELLETLVQQQLSTADKSATLPDGNVR
jgi:hypothetical protein